MIKLHELQQGLEALGIWDEIERAARSSVVTRVVENGGGGGGTASAFTDLTDAPSSYVGQNGKLVSVKADETGLEFIDAPSAGVWGAITGDINNQTDLINLFNDKVDQTDFDTLVSSLGNLAYLDDLSTFDTGDLSEGSNLYYTDARVQAFGDGRYSQLGHTHDDRYYTESEVDTLTSGRQPLDSTLTALAAYNTNGILTQTGTDTFVGRTITGTTDRVTVSNGDGVSGNPTIDISSSYAGQATIATLGTITTGTWNGTDIAVADGGTGASTAADARTNLGLIAGGVGDIWVEKAGDSMTGNLLVTGGAGIGIGATPSSVVLFHLKKDQNNVVDAIYENQDSGAAAQVRFQLRNGSSALDGLTVGVTGTGFTTNGGFFGDAAYLSAESNLNGMSFIARGSSAGLRFYTGGFADANKRLEINSAGLATFVQSVDIDTNLTVDGVMAVGTTTSSSIAVNVAKSFTTTGGIVGISATPVWAPSTGSSAITNGLSATLTVDTTGGNLTSGFAAIGMTGRVSVQGSANTVAGATGANYQVVILAGQAANVNNAYGAVWQNNISLGTGVIASSAGAAIADQTGGATNNTNLVVGSTSIPTGSFSIYNSSTKVNYFAGNTGIGDSAPGGKLHVEQSSTTAAIPTLWLRQADLSEEFFRFEATVSAGNPINTTALGAYYGRIRVYVEGVGAKWMALYD